jgi:hypothetical protein
MPITIDDTGLLRGIDELLRHIPAQAEKGLARQAGVAEAEMQSTNAHGDITGATRASYRAFVIGGAHTGAAEAASGLDAAIAAIASAVTDHGGRPASMDSGIRLGTEERGVLLTSYTDYQDALEIDNAGAKAVLGPTLQANAQAFTQAIASEGL